MELGLPIEPFDLPATGQRRIALSDYRGRHVVLYFYPKDNTTGCTSESVAFAAAHPLFEAADAVILGINKDSIASHETFKAKYSLPFDLLSDRDGAVCRRFGVIGEKIMFGRPMTGIIRSTFLIDPQGILRRAWRGVTVEGHCREVLDALGVQTDLPEAQACRLPG